VRSVSTDIHYQYAGYVPIEDWSTKLIWRQRLLLFTERFVFYQFPNSHILQYVILVSTNLWSLDSAASTGFGMLMIRRQNYRILTDKMAGATIDSTRTVSPDVEHAFIYADNPPVKSLLGQPQEPFVQAILDLGVPQMTFGRWH